MTREEAREVLGDVRAYLASRGSLENEMLAGHTFTDICNAIKALEHESDWIPVSERLPEKDGQYLVTIKNLTGYEQLCNDVFECEFFGRDWIFKGWKDNKVIAWMPLPQPYKAESEEV